MPKENFELDLDGSFITGLACGVCAGVSLIACRNFYKTAKILKTLPSSSGLKMVFVVRSDLNMTKGKIAAQCGHAAVEAYKEAMKIDPNSLQLWELTGQTKVALRTDSVNEVLDIHNTAKKYGLVTALIRDDGRTQIPQNTVTVLSIGPAAKDLVDNITGHLKLL